MAIFTAIAGAIFGAGTFMATAAATVMSVGATVGLSYVAQSLSGKQPSAGEAVKASFAVSGQLQAGAALPRSFVLGRHMVAGVMVYGNTWGHAGETPNAYLTQVIKLADLPSGPLHQVWVDGELCTLDSGSHPDYGRPVLEYRRDGVDHLWVKYYDGRQTAADGFLVGKVGSAQRPYGAKRVGRGIAYVICTALLNERLLPSIPKFKFVIDGLRLYDPSKDSSVGGSGPQRYSDPATWGGDGDHLPAVQIYNLLRGIRDNGQWVYGLQATMPARLPIDNWLQQIAKCRAQIAGENGFEPTYRAGGQIMVNAPLADANEALLSSCQGRLSEVGGAYKLHVGAPAIPSFAFSDGDLLSTEEHSYRPFFALADSVNGVQARYPDPAQGWAIVPAPAYYRTDLEAIDGGRRLMANPTLDFVPYAAQVQRLQKSAIEEAQRARTHRVVLPPEFWSVEPGDVGAWTSERHGYDGKLFRVDAVADCANLDIVLDLTEVDPADFDWDHAAEFAPVTSGTTRLQRPQPQAIVDCYAVPHIMRDPSGLDRRPAIMLSFDASLPGISALAFVVRLASDKSIVHRGTVDFALAPGAVVISQGLLPATAYELQAQYIPTSPRDMVPSDWIAVTTPDVRLTADELNDGVKYSIGELQRGLLDEVRALEQRVSNLVAAVAARGVLDKHVLHQETADGYARAERFSAALSTLNESFASYSTTVTASLGSLSAGVIETAEAVAKLDGKVGARWTVTVNSNEAVSGISLISGQSGMSAFVVQADMFKVQLPTLNGGAAQPVFSIGMINGQPALGFAGNMYLDGSVYARHLSVQTLSSVSQDCGTLTAGYLRSPDSKTIIDLNNSRLEFWD